MQNSLDDLLCEWFRWARGYAPLGQHTTAPMFAGMNSSRQWDSENEVTDAALHSEQMRAIDFHIGELNQIQRCAIGVFARNMVTGKSVWTSALLPTDITQRQLVVKDARTALMARLEAAGIL